MKADETITDFQRNEFMTRLSADVFGHANGLVMETWEHQFLSGWRASSRPSLWFIGKRKECTDRLWRKYGLEIKFPFPQPARAPVGIPRAEAGGCQFLLRNEEGLINQPCNAEATLINNRGFRYCQTHGEDAQKAMRRRGGHMELHQFKKP
jgi:hypothetical protein